MKLKCIFGLILLGSGPFLYGQSRIKPVQFYLNEDSSAYIKATFLNQTWLRYNQNNPGSTIGGFEEKNTFDIGLRRTRIQVFGQLSDKVFFYTQFGQNNLSYRSPRKQGLFFLDATSELYLIKDKLTMGAGLTGWSGLSRYASPSIGTILSLDAPIYQQTTNDATDQFVRKYSVYAKGKVGVLDYRIALTKPMDISHSNAQSSDIGYAASFSSYPAKTQVQSYFMLQLWDRESNLTPYMVGSYLGTKKVLTLGVGNVYQKDAMWRAKMGDTLKEDMRLAAADVFMELPLNSEKNNAVTVYVCASRTHFGFNYLRNVGVMNATDGGGNAFPMLGTGKTLFLQLAYLFKKDLCKGGRFQVYGNSQISAYNALDENMVMYEGGFNYLIHGHASKLSLGVQNRPVFELNSLFENRTTSRKNMIVLQYQISI